LSNDIEEWANNLILEDTTDWKDVKCNPIFRKNLNKKGNTKCYLKWLPDPRKREQQKEEEDTKKEKLYPCMKVISTVDAPYEHVCSYLSNPSHVSEYNDTVEHHKEVEDISPNSKICWSSCQQLLFLKPMDFVTFCSLKWKNGGDTQLVLSEAVDHDSVPGNHGDHNVDKDNVDKDNASKDSICDESGKKRKDKRFTRAFALRGANFISRHPEHNDKTLLTLLAHGSPGCSLPSWTIKIAVEALAPVEPFKICHRIEVGSRKLMVDGKDEIKVDMFSHDDNNIHDRPGGLSQLGYACFWPYGGGVAE